MEQRAADRLTFSKGLVTDSNPTTPVPDSASTLDNFILNRDGSIETRRRLAVTEGPNALPGFTYSSTQNISYYTWNAVGNTYRSIITKAISGIDSGSGQYVATLTGYNPVNDNTLFTVLFRQSQADIAAGSPGNPVVIDAVVAYKDHLLLSIRNAAEWSNDNGSTWTPITATGRHLPKIWVFKYTTNLRLLTANTLQTRDFGTLSLDGFTGTPLNNRKVWNAENAGWTTAAITSYVAASGGSYPESNEIAQLGVNASGTFDYNLLKGQQFSETPAPKGNRTTVPYYLPTSRSTTLGGSTTSYPAHNLSIAGSLKIRIISMEVMASRVWYLVKVDRGDNSAYHISTNFICYSEVIDDQDSFTICHSKLSPTDPFNNNPLPTDGGYIPLQADSEAHTLKALDNNLVIFDTRGISILQSDGAFDPTRGNFILRQLSSTTTVTFDNTGSIQSYSPIGGAVTETFLTANLTAYNMISVEDNLFFLSNRGVEVIARREGTDTYVVRSLTEGKISEFMASIPMTNLARASVVHHTEANSIVWLFADQHVGTSPWVIPTNMNAWQCCNRLLVLDLGNGSISTHTFGNAGDSEEVEVYPNYIYNWYGRQPEARIDSTNIRFMGERDAVGTITLLDWATSDDLYGADFNSLDGTASNYTAIPYMCEAVTNEITLEETIRTKSNMSITTNFAIAETATDSNSAFVTEGTCLGQVAWDYSNFTTTNGSRTNEYQLYRLSKVVGVGASESYDYGQDVITTKTRFRGRGKAFRLRLKGEPGKLTHLLSYGYTINARGAV